ncbi:hypothetical protein HDF10_002335 [Edaphobacter lichenicola]|uniref:Uncharacterized protein n=1 Tax=Tunturiibacter lichenicola TaxID=2051959 RepID=A0A7W8N595_9BACT|nr:hypothetical protein [Edaphobacter lichenicola]
MFLLQHAGGSLADDDTRCHCVSGRHARQNRGVRYTKTFDTMNPKLIVDH